MKTVSNLLCYCCLLLLMFLFIQRFGRAVKRLRIEADSEEEYLEDKVQVLRVSRVRSSLYCRVSASATLGAKPDRKSTRLNSSH